MSLIESDLQKFIKEEQKEYNAWKRDHDKFEKANDQKLALLNAGGISARGKAF